ncbi:MAG TPA: hypothetical protein VHX52_00685 [Steroidobacteraceae bacterium]|nr:hypothetical protein [Steroidobacteraceae bacterium]
MIVVVGADADIGGLIRAARAGSRAAAGSSVAQVGGQPTWLICYTMRTFTASIVAPRARQLQRTSTYGLQAQHLA